jgi:hypothetical protein
MPTAKSWNKAGRIRYASKGGALCIAFFAGVSKAASVERANVIVCAEFVVVYVAYKGDFRFC